jgi:carboxyl-terminal processing protease
VKITKDTSLKVTVAKWMTPNGLSISEKGLEPNIVVPITIDDIKKQKDPQMDKAVEILLKK